MEKKDVKPYAFAQTLVVDQSEINRERVENIEKEFKSLDLSETNQLKSTIRLKAKRIEQLEKQNLQLLAKIDVLLQVIKES